MNLIKNFKLLFFLSLIALMTNSCGLPGADAKKYPPDPKKRVKKNMEEGRGFKIGKLGKNKSGGDFLFATSNPLWRAALEKLDFAPLNNVDYAGGIIVTDWFSEGGSDEQIKITVRFLTNEIRTDAVEIIIHKKTCNSQNNCKINKVESKINSQIKFAILKKAAQIKNNDLAKKKENSEPARLPKSF